MAIQKKTRSTKGITLLEILLVVALLTLGMLLLSDQYQKNLFNRNTSQIQNSLQLLTSALEQYYDTNCSALLAQYRQFTLTPALIMPYITTPQMLGNAYAVTSGINAYTYVIDTTTDFPILEISTTFNSKIVSRILLNALAARLKPTLMNQYTFTWKTAPANTLLTPASLNPALSYLNTLSADLPDNEDIQLTCSYWQQPAHRCKIAGGSCTYSSPS